MANLSKTPLLKVENLCKKFPIHRSIFGKAKQFIPVIDHVSFEVFENETLGIVGESGSGKSTLCRLVMQLIASNYGKIWFQGQLISPPQDKQGSFRKNIQMIFQDTSDALNPRFTAQELVMEPLIIHRYKNHEQRIKRVKFLFDLVGLSQNDLSKYAHQFSGGQKQRIGIARALALSPKLVVADEPVSALDISIQSQILKLFSDIQKEFKISFLLVSHDLNVVRKMCQRVLILYLGKVVEFGHCKQIFSNPQHPYTQVLIDSILQISPHNKKKIKPIQGEIASFTQLPEGCYFGPRCPYKTKKCEQQYPVLTKKTTKSGENLLTACWHSEQIARNRL